MPIVYLCVQKEAFYSTAGVSHWYDTSTGTSKIVYMYHTHLPRHKHQRTHEVPAAAGYGPPLSSCSRSRLTLNVYISRNRAMLHSSVVHRYAFCRSMMDALRQQYSGKSPVRDSHRTTTISQLESFVTCCTSCTRLHIIQQSTTFRTGTEFTEIGP